VKLHFKPDVFKQLDREIVGKYAGIFNITVEELITFGSKQ